MRLYISSGNIMFLWCPMTTRPVNSCQMLCVTNYLKIKRLIKGVSSSCSQAWSSGAWWGLVVKLCLRLWTSHACSRRGSRWRSSCTPRHLTAAQWDARLYLQVRVKPLLVHITNIPLSKQANPPTKKSCTGHKFGLIIQSVTHGFKFSCGEKQGWKGRKKNQSQHYFPVWWEK